MSGVVCAIRGGPASQPTIEKAISLAKEYLLPLYFLYVVNLDFLERTASSRVHLISKEMHQMGDFILLSAQEKAQKEGVVSEGIVRDGNVSEEIVGLCRELKADYVVLGRPKGEDDEANVFTNERLWILANLVEGASGAKAVFTNGE
jgi:nucleotide-binding universal stress UspA family protein